MVSLLNKKNQPHRTILLIRHGAAQFRDKKNWQEKADPLIELSTTGHRHGFYLSLFMEHFLHQNQFKHVTIYNSPFRRCLQTGAYLYHALRQANLDPRWIKDDRLTEQNFSFFRKMGLEKCRRLYPVETRLYEKTLQETGRFYARPPLGESRADLTERCIDFVRDFHHQPDDLSVIVAHGTTNRALYMLFCHETVAWFEQETHKEHASVIRLELQKDDLYRDVGTIYQPASFYLPFVDRSRERD